MTHVRRVDLRLYPLPALEQAVQAFSDRCKVTVTPDDVGATVTLEVPDAASDDVDHEFFNFALSAALELHLRAA